MKFNKIRVETYRSADGTDCTMQGPSSVYKDFVLVYAEGDKQIERGEFEEHAEQVLDLDLHEIEPVAEHVLVVQQLTRGEDVYLSATPLDVLLDKRQSMMGGNFCYTSDSRLRRVSQYPIAIHDREEG